MNLPASPAARRREEEVRIRQRLEAMDSKLDACLGTIGGAQPGGAQAPPPVAAVAAVEFDARDVAEVASLLFDGCVRFGGVPHSISRVVPPRDPPTCDAVVFPMLGRFTVEECIRSGLISATGRFNREVHSKMMAASGARRDLRWARPMTPEHTPAFAGRIRTTD
jgi:hypothetical protein